MEPYRVYKPNNQKTGSALSIDFNKAKKSIFLEFSKQKDEKSFDWENKLILKLNIADIAKICVLYKDKKEELTLYHDPSKGQYESTTKNNILKITKSNYGINFKINQQEKDSTLNTISINLSEDEMYTLFVLFNKVIEEIYFEN